MCERTSSFSPCGSFYASLGVDGKIRVWNTSNDSLLRTYIPDKHLSAPITCIQWITSKSGKRKSEADTSMSLSLLVFGTSSGHLLVYNLSLSKLVTNIGSKIENKINCLAWNEISKQDIYSYSENKYISVWNISNNNVKILWKISKIKIKAINLSSDCSHLITASNSISIWNIESKSIVKSFIGHISEITSMHSVSLANDLYVISASKGDRMLSVWSLKGKDKTSVANFKTDESVSSISLNNSNGQTSLVAVNSCGALHYFTHQLNGKCIKPIDAKSTLYMYKDKEKQHQVNIVNAQMCSDNQILISYGQGYMLSFDKIDMKSYANQTVVALVREEKINHLIKSNQEKEENRINFKTKESDTSDAVYSHGGVVTNGDVNIPILTNGGGPSVSSSPSPTVNSLKRKNNVQELVMEDRLKNLIIEKPDQKGSIKLQSDGLTQLLIQGLNSKDKKILETVLLNRKESVIENTVKKLPAQYLTPLIQEVVKNVDKSFIRHTSLKWLRYIVLCHASVLQSNPALISIFLPMLTQIESRSSSIAPLVRLNGRLNLLFDQMNRSHEDHVVDDQQTNTVEFQDQDSEDENSDDILLGMEDGASDDSDDVWEEMSDNDNEDDDAADEEAMSVDEDGSDSSGDDEDEAEQQVNGVDEDDDEEEDESSEEDENEE